MISAAIVTQGLDHSVTSIVWILPSGCVILGLPMNVEQNLHEQISECVRTGRAVAVVTVVSADRSTPQCPGAKMMVYPNGRTSGTIGGGVVEAFVIREAMEALKEEQPRLTEHLLTEAETGMYCGGKMSFFIEVHPAKATLFVLGAGHVGKAVAKLAEFLGVPTVISDDRPEYADSRLYPNAQVVCEPFESVFDKLNITEKDFVVVVTRCHAHDEMCLGKAMKTSARYIGVIGSTTKTKTMFGHLQKCGINPYADTRVYAPIGLDLGDETVENIALSIHSEIAQIKSGRSGGNMRARLVKVRENEV